MKTGGNLGLGCWCLPAASQPAGLCGPDTPGGRDQNVFSTPHYTGCSVREFLAFTQRSSQTFSLLVPKDSWQVAQHTDEGSEGRNRAVYFSK